MPTKPSRVQANVNRLNKQLKEEAKQAATSVQDANAKLLVSLEEASARIAHLEDAENRADFNTAIVVSERDALEAQLKDACAKFDEAKAMLERASECHEDVLHKFKRETQTAQAEIAAKLEDKRRENANLQQVLVVAQDVINTSKADLKAAQKEVRLNKATADSAQVEIADQRRLIAEQQKVIDKLRDEAAESTIGSAYDEAAITEQEAVRAELEAMCAELARAQKGQADAVLLEHECTEMRRQLHAYANLDVAVMLASVADESHASGVKQEDAGNTEAVSAQLIAALRVLYTENTALKREHATHNEMVRGLNALRNEGHGN